MRDVSKQVILYAEQVQRLALPGPGGEAPKMVADMNKGFTQEELAFIQNQELPLPADIFLQTLKEPNMRKKPVKAQHKLIEGKIRMKLLNILKGLTS